ncbi:hypothetical protein VR7878_03106 [Vibrio ruber DSM 16370]|uniref:Uncharacterized protein n=1 Tax=Vibrio ruber (strain DSM 16370 / JCM 11486 / BCRC 17186 / CECT 7878 / LMG 23124 / VR1) TaxID=1123498 RepID=A0A1R4LR82_VIBR1|nr:hypothetical protein [Vibrio ruber]SJN58899.1 hypothetical protein VR7878_03106 [Vibrio ruber DSM 16370]
MSEFVKDKLKLIAVSVVLAVFAYLILASLNIVLGDKISWFFAALTVYWIAEKLLGFWTRYKSRRS